MLRHLLASSALLLALATTSAAGAAAADEPAHADFVVKLLQLGPVKPFGRPITIHSASHGTGVRAGLEALVERPFRDVHAALADPSKWCAALILHINNSGCRVDAGGAVPRIVLKVSQSHDEPAEEALELVFEYRTMALSARQLSVQLSAAKGFVGTFDHVLVFDAATAGPSRTAIRLSYSYRQNRLADWAVSFYLATFGRGKVGFSEVDDDGQARHVGGIRGLLERNLMLYLIAIESAAKTPLVPDQQAFRQRLRDYFAATELHRRQLREVDLETYLALKEPLAPVGIAASGH